MLPAEVRGGGGARRRAHPSRARVTFFLNSQTKPLVDVSSNEHRATQSEYVIVADRTFKQQLRSPEFYFILVRVPGACHCRVC